MSEESSSQVDDNFVEFRAYSSFKNAYVETEVEFIKRFVPEDELWVAMEKVHGCNFSATTNGKETKWASRSGYLEPTALQKFYNSHTVVEKYEDTIQSTLFDAVKAQLAETHGDTITHIRVFGELFGGKYEGHTVNHRAIQKEVSYCPGIEFMVFDIQYIVDDQEEEKINEQQEDEGEENVTPRLFLTPMEVIEICKACEIPVLDVLHVGTLEEMMSLNPVFQTTIPTTVFALEPTTHNNEAEGYVLKPKSQIFYKPDTSRIMLKHKNSRFTENKSEKAIKTPNQPKNPGAQDLSGYEVNVFEEIKQFINENRINAVLSKLDDDMRSKRKAVLFLISNDAFEDVLIELNHVQEAPKKEKAKYKKHLNAYTEEYCDFHKIDFLS
jgi:Rnl2 family RNA ligase